MKKNLGTVGWVLAFILFFFISSSAVSAVIREFSKEEPKEEYVLPQTLEDSLVEKSEQLDSNKLKDAIVGGCLGEAVDQEPYCNCAAEYVISNISKADILSMSLEYDKSGTMSKDLADIMADAVYACIDEYQY